MKIAVIGGGIGGLTAARALVRAGFDAHVLEAGPRLGGVVGTSKTDGYLREHAASSFLGGPSRGALALCKELGVAVEHASARAKTRWVYLDGKLRELPRSPVSLARSDLLTWRGKLALLREPFAKGRAKGEDESVHAFAARRFGPEAARAFVAPFVTGVFAADSHEISLEAGFPRFAALDDAGGIARGMIRQGVRGMIGKLRGGKSSKTESGLWAPVGGVGSIIDALGAELGDRVRIGTPVRAVAPDAKGVLVDGERWDAVVLAVPAADGAAIVVDALPELAAKLDPFFRAPVAIVYLGFPESALPASELGAFGFLVAHGEDLRVLGVVFESTVWPDRAPAGHVLLRCIFGGGRDPEAASLPESDLISIARHDVGIALGISADPSHASAIRWEHGIAQYRVGHRDLVRAAAAVGRANRIVLAGADYRGTALNDLCGDADTVVAEIRAW
jgi:oxygen-dependent protoporphyrinogen oxidase